MKNICFSYAANQKLQPLVAVFGWNPTNPLVLPLTRSAATFQKSLKANYPNPPKSPDFWKDFIRERHSGT